MYTTIACPEEMERTRFIYSRTISDFVFSREFQKKSETKLKATLPGQVKYRKYLLLFWKKYVKYFEMTIEFAGEWVSAFKRDLISFEENYLLNKLLSCLVFQTRRWYLILAGIWENAYFGIENSAINPFRTWDVQFSLNITGIWFIMSVSTI